MALILVPMEIDPSSLEAKFENALNATQRRVTLTCVRPSFLLHRLLPSVTFPCLSCIQNGSFCEVKGILAAGKGPDVIQRQKKRRKTNAFLTTEKNKLFYSASCEENYKKKDFPQRKLST